MTSEKSLKKELAGNGFIALSTVFWGVNYAFTKALVPVWMTSDDVSAVRLAGGAVLFWIASLFLKAEKLDKNTLERAALGGLVGLFGCIYLFVLSLNYGSAIDISIIMTMPPIFVILLEVCFKGRRPSPLEYLGIAVSFVGAIVVILADSTSSETASHPLMGDLMALGASVCFAFYLFILAGPSTRYKPVSLLRWVFLFSTPPALFLVPGLFRMPLLHSGDPARWLEIAFILFCPTFLSYLFAQPAIKDIGAVPVSLYQYLTPVVAAISAILMGVDTFRWMEAVAMALVVAGMLLANYGKKFESRRETSGKK